MNEFSRTIELLESGIADGQQAGVQLYVSLGGDVLADTALGEARPGVAMTVDSIVPWMSSGKPITAAGILRLADNGALRIDDPVAEHVPEFAGGGKHAITIRHLLTQTAGLQGVDNGWPQSDWDAVVATIAAAELPTDWEPGGRAAYDPANGWFVLGEIIARLEEKPFPRAIRELVLDPLEMPNAFCGLDPTDQERMRDRLGMLYERSRDGLRPRERMLEADVLTSASPGGGFRGPIRELGRFYERLGSLVDVHDVTARHREGLRDETFLQTIDFGLGVIIDSKQYGEAVVAYGYGPHASERAFGHGGVQSSIGFRDPEHDLVVAWITNGMIGEPRHRARNWAINTAIYKDLGLAG